MHLMPNKYPMHVMDPQLMDALLPLQLPLIDHTSTTIPFAGP